MKTAGDDAFSDLFKVGKSIVVSGEASVNLGVMNSTNEDVVIKFAFEDRSEALASEWSICKLLEGERKMLFDI